MSAIVILSFAATALRVAAAASAGKKYRRFMACSTSNSAARVKHALARVNFAPESLAAIARCVAHFSLSSILRSLRIWTERARSDYCTLLHLRGHDRVGRFSLFDPWDDLRERIEACGADPAAAVERHHGKTRLIGEQNWLQHKIGAFTFFPEGKVVSFKRHCGARGDRK